MKLQKNKATKTPMTVLFAIALTIMILYTIIMFALIGWGFLKSLQTVEDFIYQGSSYSSFPKEFGIGNYIASFSQIEYKNVMLGGMFFNSILYAGGCAAAAFLIHRAIRRTPAYERNTECSPRRNSSRTWARDLPSLRPDTVSAQYSSVPRPDCDRKWF